jgi:DNA-binding NarL/FixJ family response regulator
MPIRVAIFEDNKLIRESLSLLVQGTPGLELAAAYPDCNNLLQRLENSKPQVVLMDISMPGMSGVEAVKVLKEQFPDIIVVMQTVFDDDEKVFEAICSGASGYLLKDTQPALIMQAIHDAYNGGAPMSPSIARKALSLFQKYLAPMAATRQPDYQLTNREKEILQHLVNGNSYKQIAAMCNISFDTVRTHIRNVYEKLHVASSTEAVAKALRERLV